MSACGGCGATKNSERCIGCMHDFGDEESAWVRKPARGMEARQGGDPQGLHGEATTARSAKPRRPEGTPQAAAQGEALTELARLREVARDAAERATELQREVLRLRAALASPVEAPQAEQKDERTLRCANCGKRHEHADDCISDYPEEGEWFCSQTCYDQHSELGCPHGTHNGYRHPAEAARLIACEAALRSLACWLGVGGYNADTVDAAVFEAKIREGVELFAAPPPEQAAQPAVGALAAEQIDRLIERHVGGAELDDDGYYSMFAFARSIEAALTRKDLP